MKNCHLLVLLCGMMDHMEDQCDKYCGWQDDDYAKSCGKWFQDDVLGKNYRKHVGKWFGLGSKGVRLCQYQLWRKWMRL